MNNQNLKQQLELETNVLYEEWKDIATLIYLTEEKPLNHVLKKKYQLPDKYANFLSKKISGNIV